MTASAFHSLPRPAMQLSGIHHLTAVSADAPGNVKFYTKLLGLRLVKKTVNQDDVSAYQLLYEDGEASAGSELTFFELPTEGEQRIRGLGPITMTVPELRPTDLVLTNVMNARQVRDYPHPESNHDRVHVYEMGEGGPAAELHVAVRSYIAPAHPGAGGVHHVAFRSPDKDYDAWAERLRELRIPNSGKVDRYWFRSLYFREPNGILFEIASDGPGFAVDEPLEKLGESLVLPPFLEGKRKQIEAGLKPL